jgi:hypothetical protein
MVMILSTDTNISQQMAAAIFKKEEEATKNKMADINISPCPPFPSQFSSRLYSTH